jgi:3-hydroxy-3-methylglutaryl CoA synthase
MGSITAIGGYLPLLRLDRAHAAKALRHFGLGGRQAGFRSIGGWDEDALTVAAEASRGLAEPAPVRIGFASTSAPFLDRSHAGLIVDALALPRAIRSVDVAGTRRCATSLLLDMPRTPPVWEGTQSHLVGPLLTIVLRSDLG